MTRERAGTTVRENGSCCHWRVLSLPWSEKLVVTLRYPLMSSRRRWSAWRSTTRPTQCAGWRATNCIVLEVERNSVDVPWRCAQNIPFSFGESFETGWPTSQSSAMRSCSNRKMCTTAMPGAFGSSRVTNECAMTVSPKGIARRRPLFSFHHIRVSLAFNELDVRCCPWIQTRCEVIKRVISRARR